MAKDSTVPPEGETPIPEVKQKTSFQEHSKNLHEAILRDKGMTPEAGEGEEPPSNTPEEKPEVKKGKFKNPFISNPVDDGSTPENPPAPPKDELADLKGPDEKSKVKPEWEKLKGLAQSYRKQSDEMKAALEELKKNSAPATELETLKTSLKNKEVELTAVSDKLKVFDLQNHPEFQNKYTAPMKQAVDTLQSIFTEAGVEDVSAETFLHTPKKEAKEIIKKVMDSLDPISQNIVTQVYTEYKRLVFESSKELTTAKATLENYKATSQQQQQQVFAEVLSKTPVGIKAIELNEEMSPEQKADATAFNTALGEIVKKAEHIALRTTSMQEAAQASLQAAQFQFISKELLPRMQKAFAAELAARDAKIAKYEKAEKARRGAIPSSVTSAPRGNETPEPGDEGENPAQQFVERMQTAIRGSNKRARYREFAEKLAAGQTAE